MHHNYVGRGCFVGVRTDAHQKVGGDSHHRVKTWEEKQQKAKEVRLCVCVCVCVCERECEEKREKEEDKTEESESTVANPALIFFGEKFIHRICSYQL